MNTATLVPLIGGSGGDGGSWGSGASGGSGAGAILIACPGTINITGYITASGGNGAPTGEGGYISHGGSGGAIRLVCNTLSGSGSLYVNRGMDNYSPATVAGCLRFETNNFAFTGNCYPAGSAEDPVTPAATPAIWPSSTAPVISISSIAGVAAPADPLDTFQYLHPDVQTAQDPSQPAAIIVVVQAANVPTNWTVTVRAVSALDGRAYQATATMQAGGTLESSTWTATLTLPAHNVASITACANAPSS